MKLRTHDKDGRLVRIRVDERVVHRYDEPEVGTTDGILTDDAFPDDPKAVASGDGFDDDDDDDEGATTEAVILVEPLPNAMTVEGAIAGIGVMARKMSSDPHAVNRAWDNSGLGRITRRRSAKQWVRAVVNTLVAVGLLGGMVYSIVRSWLH